MEAGAHSPWISRFLEALGWRVVVSNPRKVRAIYQHERKSDQRDALMLARIGRMDLALLYPVRHGTAEAQQDLLRIKLRDSLGASSSGGDQRGYDLANWKSPRSRIGLNGVVHKTNTIFKRQGKKY